jgi:kynureninase
LKRELIHGTGFDMKTITTAGHKAGAKVGWDEITLLEHKIRTHRLNVDLPLGAVINISELRT